MESLKRLDFDKILDMISEYCHSEATRELIRGLSPFNDLESIKERFGQIREIRRMREEGSDLLFYDFEDISGIIDRVRPEGVALDSKDLLILLSVFRLLDGILEVFNKSSLPYLGPLLKGVSGFVTIRSRIERTIDEEGNILDLASPLLKEIRNNKRAVERRIKKRLKELITDKRIAPFLQDSFISMRSERWVIPVRMDSKGEVKGVVHDVSRSGDTAFIEPMEIIGLSNELENIIAEERVEELRILREISDLIRKDADEIMRQFSILLKIDLLNSITLFCEGIKAEIPDINDSGLLRLKEARHPLLMMTKNDDEVIPLNIDIKESERIMVVTGPNAGGKTVAVKTIGFLTEMALSGIPIPASSSSSIPLIKNIYVDIGDEQSIIDNLSTFSGHIRRISDIISRVGPGDMVIMDELGTGTDPSQGASLGCSILEELRDKGAIVFATTHLLDIVGFVYTEEGMINASMEFDQRTLKPLYRLRIGEPGESHAFEIALRCGLSEDIIERARSRFTKGSNLYNLINELKEKVNHYNGLIREEQLRLDRLVQQEEEIRRKLDLTEKERKEILRKAHEEAKDMLIDMKRRLNCLMEEARVKKLQIVTKEIADIHNNIEERIRFLKDEPLMNLEDIKEGNMVFVKSIGEDLRVSKVLIGKRAVRVRLKNMEVEVPLEDISLPRGKETVTKGFSVAIEEKVEDELNIMGLRVEEGIRRLEPFLNHAFLHGLREVRIIHGIGKGLLLKAVREYLKGHELVEKFGPSEIGKGGEGVTIVRMASRL